MWSFAACHLCRVTDTPLLSLPLPPMQDLTTRLCCLEEISFPPITLSHMRYFLRWLYAIVPLLSFPHKITQLVVGYLWWVRQSQSIATNIQSFVAEKIPSFKPRSAGNRLRKFVGPTSIRNKKLHRGQLSRRIIVSVLPSRA